MWRVLQFSAAASVVAAVILGVKLLFHDKLDARWHYLIWLVLLVRMLVPVQLDLIRTPVSLFETIPVLRWLALCELAAHKAGMDGPMEVLFWIYLAGAAAFFLYDSLCYLGLRLRIAFSGEDSGQGAGEKKRRLWKASENVCRRVEGIADKYGLKTCRKICVQDVPAPYVCGLWKTALVLTEEMACRLEKERDTGPGTGRTAAFCKGSDGRHGTGGEGGRMPAGVQETLDPDEAVLVHELLHRKHKDVLVNFTLHLVRTLNWFNPFIWYVTGVVQNDSEALCDQRVLECMERNCGRKAGCEKEYGMLLIRMAEGKGRKTAKVGTSNMANSFRNMKTRIRRIADFKKVPAGIWPVTLCITLMLSVSGIGCCQEQGWQELAAIESDRDLKIALLNAELYEAKTLEEALYIYLAAIRLRNPAYMMAVMPEAMRQEYDRWVRDNYRWNEDRFEFGDWSGQWEEAGYFPAQCGERYAFSGFTVYNLYSETENAGGAVVLARLFSEQEEAVWWEVELVRENGWKVRKKGEPQTVPEKFEEPALLRASGQGEAFRVEVDCRNEERLQEPGVQAAFGRSAGENEMPYENGSARALQFSGEHFTEYKMASNYLCYTGNEDLTGRLVGVVMLKEGESREDHEDCFQAVGRGMGGGGSPLVSEYSNVEGSELMDGGRISIGGGGVSPDSWEIAEKPAWHVWIYVDRVLAEEFDVRVP